MPKAVIETGKPGPAIETGKPDPQWWTGSSILTNTVPGGPAGAVAIEQLPATPRSPFGQMITFAIDVDQDQRLNTWKWIDVRNGDTVQKIAKDRGHPEDARKIADANGIRDVTKTLTDREQIKVPAQLGPGEFFHVLAGESPPKIVAGYAKLSVLARSQRTGLSQFDGYDPLQMSVPIRFEADAAYPATSDQVEKDCSLLERMAGRGDFKGAADGPPPVIRVVTEQDGRTIALIPANYQWSQQNPSAPTWQVAGIDWDDTPSDGVVRDGSGRRTRQKATVTLQQATTVKLLSRSATERAKGKASAGTKKKSGKSGGGGGGGSGSGKGGGGSSHKSGSHKPSSHRVAASPDPNSNATIPAHPSNQPARGQWQWESLNHRWWWGTGIIKTIDQAHADVVFKELGHVLALRIWDGGWHTFHPH